MRIERRVLERMGCLNTKCGGSRGRLRGGSRVESADGSLMRCGSLLVLVSGLMTYTVTHYSVVSLKSIARPYTIDHGRLPMLEFCESEGYGTVEISNLNN